MSDMRQVTQVVDADGGVVQATYSAPRITVGYSRKVNLEARGGFKYENAEAQVHVQCDIPLDADDAAKVKAIKDSFLLARTACFEQLDIPFDVDDQNRAIERLERSLGASVVTEPQQASTPAPRPRTDTQAPKSKTDLWNDLASNPGNWYDNRESKRNPKAPDFKRKGTGEGLWATYNGKSSVPAGIEIPSSGFANAA